MVESTGGKHYKNRNILGWGSALQRFPSEQAGIQYVSSRLHSSPLYTRKSLNQMLLTYNSERRNYVTLVTEVMRQLTVVKSELEAQQAAIAAAEQPSSKLQRGHSYLAGKGDIFILPWHPFQFHCKPEIKDVALRWRIAWEEIATVLVQMFKRPKLRW
jgi:hypothetical protein